MEKDLFNIKMEMNMMLNGKMIYKMVKEHLILLMVIYIKANFNKNYFKGEGLITWKNH